MGKYLKNMTFKRLCNFKTHLKPISTHCCTPAFPSWKQKRSEDVIYEAIWTAIDTDLGQSL